ncbi:MAG: sigma-E processing peptidase SpoIIGA [Syntrophomonadaceae bacterium]|nr:sigma-E processing peptidase SpoIIGA [Syntrophomonadaceae bacterium]
MNGPVVYADLTFVINFIMDFCILWATGKLSGIKISYPRLLVASTLGGIYAVGYLFPEMALWYSFPIKIIFSVLLVIFALWPPNWSYFKKALLYFYGISFLVAGATIASSFFFNSDQYAFSFSYIWLLGGIFCALLIGIYGEKYISKRIIPSLLRFRVHLKFAGSSCEGEGFLDTGNGLRDPLTNKPVLVAEYNLIRTCLPDDIKRVMDNPASEEEMLEQLTRCSWATRLRLIPFSSIGKRNGLLIGIRADEVTLINGNNSIFHKNIIVGIYLDKISNEGSYQMLIPSEIIQPS